MRFTEPESDASPSSTLKAVWNKDVSSKVSWSSQRAPSTWLKGSSELARALRTVPFTLLSSCLNVGSPAQTILTSEQGHRMRNVVNKV